jgi:hypothetical protein
MRSCSWAQCLAIPSSLDRSKLGSVVVVVVAEEEEEEEGENGGDGVVVVGIDRFAVVVVVGVWTMDEVQTWLYVGVRLVEILERWAAASAAVLVVAAADTLKRWWWKDETKNVFEHE